MRDPRPNPTNDDFLAAISKGMIIGADMKSNEELATAIVRVRMESDTASFFQKDVLDIMYEILRMTIDRNDCDEVVANTIEEIEEEIDRENDVRIILVVER